MKGRPGTGRCAREHGFAFIELIVVIAILVILASALVPELAVRVDGARESVTRKEMQRLVRAMNGDPEMGRQGYVADMGRHPAGNGLAELVAQGSQPSHVLGLGGVGMGWAGPYVTGQLQGADWLRDGWDRPYQFGSATGQITSAGRDGAFGTGDDLALPDAPIQYLCQLSATVRADDALAPGTTIPLDATTVRVFVYYPVEGVETSLEMAWSGAAFAAPGGQLIPLGLRAVRAVGQDGGVLGDYSGREVVVAAALRAAHIHVALYLPGDQPAAGGGDSDNDGVAEGEDVAPANPNLCRDADGDGCDDCTHTGANGSGGDPANDGPDADGDGICDASDDSDGDGVSDAGDICPGTPPATVVDPATGCSVAQLVPCAGPFGSSAPWTSHGQYVSSVTQTAQAFVNQGLLTQAEGNALVVEATHSDCGSSH
jgi:prepilin-type N-terminal cleavage/methylation domain-containing protein